MHCNAHSSRTLTKQCHRVRIASKRTNVVLNLNDNAIHSTPTHTHTTPLSLIQTYPLEGHALIVCPVVSVNRRAFFANERTQHAQTVLDRDNHGRGKVGQKSSVVQWCSICNPPRQISSRRLSRLLPPFPLLTQCRLDGHLRHE